MSGQGISYPPPSENLPTFDSSVFKINTTPITATTGLDYFLGFPTAQGTENLQSINVGGVATFYSNIVMDGVGDYIQFPNGSKQTTAYGGGPTGDVFLAGTQTFTGVNTFNNAGGIIMSNSPSTATTTSIFQYTDNNCHFSSSVIGGGLRIQDPSVGATLAVNSNGLTINKGLQIGNTSGSNIVQMVADATTNNQLNVTGAVNVSNTQSYPSVSSQILATISYVNNAVGSLTNLLTSNNVWTGTNAFNTSTPTTTITQTYPQNTSTTQFSTIGYVNGAIASLPNTGAPIGTIQMWGGNTNPPTNYLFCSGQSLSTTGTYASLFTVIGYTYGGSGGNFTLPNFHNGTYGVMPIGSQTTANTGVVQDPGMTGNVPQPTIYNGNNSYITANQLAPHNHTINPPQGSYAWNTNTSGNTTTGGTSSRVTGLQTATFPTATNGMTNFSPTAYQQNQAQFYPSYCSVIFIIKYI